MDGIAGFIDEVLMNVENPSKIKAVGDAVVAMMKDKPLFA